MSRPDSPDPSAPPRRDMLLLLGSFAAVQLVGCGSDAETSPTSAAGPCVVRPQLTEGPYFVDERLNRSDIRSDPATGALRPGVPLRLAFQVSRSQAGACTPLPQAQVDVWHCDALGVYSDVSDPRFDTTGQKFLRGYQLSDAAGLVQFVTIYPGWYSGRAVHIHFKIRSGGLEFTSQLFFDEATTDRVHAQPPYDSRGRRNTLNDQDGIYRSGGSRLLLDAVPEGSGYAASFAIALQA